MIWKRKKRKHRNVSVYRSRPTPSHTDMPSVLVCPAKRSFPFPTTLFSSFSLSPSPVSLCRYRFYWLLRACLPPCTTRTDNCYANTRTSPLFFPSKCTRKKTQRCEWMNKWPLILLLFFLADYRTGLDFPFFFSSSVCLALPCFAFPTLHP